MSFSNWRELACLCQVSERRSGQHSSAPRHMAKTRLSSEVQKFRRSWVSTHSKMEQQRGNMCDICGCVYHWEMFFHNHLRDVHGIPTKRSKRSFLLKTNKALLESYYHNVWYRPTLEEIENVAYFLDIKKETVYWWFVNQNKRKWKAPKTKLRKKQDVAGKGCIDRVSHGTLESRKRPKEERNWGERQLDQRPDEQVWKIRNGSHLRM